MQLLRFALKPSINALMNFAFFFKVIASTSIIQYKGCGDASIGDAIGTRNQWNEFNDDYQINDLSCMHAHRTSAINYRHRRTLNRTLMHSRLSVVDLLSCLTPLCSFIHDPFSRGYLHAIIIRRASHSNGVVQKVSNTIRLSLRFTKLSRDDHE